MPLMNTPAARCKSLRISERLSGQQQLIPPIVATVESESCELSWLFMATSHNSGLLRTFGSYGSRKSVALTLKL